MNCPICNKSLKADFCFNCQICIVTILENLNTQDITYYLYSSHWIKYKIILSVNSNSKEFKITDLRFNHLTKFTLPSVNINTLINYVNNYFLL